MLFNPERLITLIGDDALNMLSRAHVAVFGAGGVGGYAIEALARSGVGEITVCDFDTVNETNINRQLCALQSTIGTYKAEVFEKRLADINPEIRVHAKLLRYCKDTKSTFFNPNPDYIIDAIDSVTDKIDLICEATRRSIPIISAMGAGNKLDAGRLHVSDICKTSVCPLARVMRRELKVRGITKLKVVYSDEPPVSKSRTPGSAVWVVGTAGLLLAGEVIKDLIKTQQEEK